MVIQIHDSFSLVTILFYLEKFPEIKHRINCVLFISSAECKNIGEVLMVKSSKVSTCKWQPYKHQLFLNERCHECFCYHHYDVRGSRPKLDDLAGKSFCQSGCESVVN